MVWRILWAIFSQTHLVTQLLEFWIGFRPGKNYAYYLLAALSPEAKIRGTV
jgi:hypothetical protein